MHIDILTLFPEMFHGVLQSSILKKAYENDRFSYNLVNFRDYTENKHYKVDDYPYGGGAGMVLTPQPIFDTVEAVKKQRKSDNSRIILMCPQGETYNQKKAEELSQEDHLIFICGHYEGYDERIREHLVTDEISIGDFVLTGGEIGSMVVMDSVVRLLPEVLGNKDSAPQDSFSTGLLEHPHYTRPADFRGLKVPEVLLSGDHGKINAWRERQSLLRTYQRRRDLLEHKNIPEEWKRWIEEWDDK
ncbi:MAG: tRNA (guanosine(37)-N1)-methyltransferase TrmD [Bacillota bacterium]|uniref:tRNA (guanine-N(1)-)-methyltransferase n=1 Tax=Virgibacillus salarius TaxID=447199 RepID=A0A941DT36_9BACI|nr:MULTISPECIES: tRNA (guanosine(37)-N1)-methyltransferase TrmD [Bacillaceae]NAZ07611.1 tRNA (guanosine(37)-N1)-methyltransferase TrmD [Agaribacter marinus]MBR7794891.1 tRNA (guanosine(37)-N1)-methyltransferase TrmD [Virgibacillus salarius]MCC2249304.1 tRNA (guanosine(37)-N1)-methyltransferase TrmD [Virgibacillus sp. AGTR]MDY7043870.1 tRNA (guanosine(37)-N1)-methyltransferase TrmD [Virgibacillus sp. M23]QRZ17337.1 tRNA (guanosine(37)-N1)-methyltransferase TrmD [Virgibacillus sp. AGTR]